MDSSIPPSEHSRLAAPVRPMLMLTGFLGAGKTTLLRSILNDLSERGHLADVILNDRENAGIDREALRDHAASVAALTGSCVCCEGLDELCKLILEAARSSHKVLLIELNGTADPLPLQETFTLLESKFLLCPRWQVCVIDARHFGQRNQFQEIEKLQLETASHYYISQSSKLSEQATLELEKIVQSINPQASRTTATELAEALSQVISRNQDQTFAQSKGEQSPPSTGSISPKVHLHARHQFAHEYTGCNIVFPKPVDSSRIVPWLEALPKSVIRAKALVKIHSDQNYRYLYERVGMDTSPEPIPVRSIEKVPCSGIFIGPDLQPGEILRLTCESLDPLCYFPKK